MSGPLTFIDAARSACIVASGPSAPEVLAQLPQGLPTIAVSDAWRLVPSAAVCYAADGQWWDVHLQECRRSFRGRCFVAKDTTAQRLGLEYVQGTSGSGLCPHDGMIYWGSGSGRNSSLQAIALAYFWGARRILLVGVDLGPSNGQAHFFGDHPPELRRKVSDYPAFQREIELLVMDLLRHGVEVINLSPHSRIAGAPSMPPKKVVSLLPVFDTA